MPPKRNRPSLRLPPMRRAATPLPGMNSTRSVLPAEIIATILDYLPIRDLMSFAQVSQRLREMVYDDTRWVTKLRLLGVWSETEARARFEDAMRRKREKEAAARASAASAAELAKRVSSTSTIFDVAEEEKRKVAETAAAARATQTRAATVDLMSGGPGGVPARGVIRDRAGILGVLKGVKSVRGFARQEYARVHGALAPLYYDLVKAATHTDPEVFRMFRDPEDQATMLSSLRRFSEADTALGWYERSSRLKAMMGLFENAALREFEGGYEDNDVDGRMRRYAHVMIQLNGGTACIQLFVQKHSVLYEKDELGNPLDCFDKPTMGSFSLNASRSFFDKLGKIMEDQRVVVERVFPATVNVMLPFLERVAEDVITEYTTPVIDEAHERNMETYLKAVVGLYRQSLDFAVNLKPTKGAGESWRQDAFKTMGRVFDQHVDLYLTEELDYFKKLCEAEVGEWGRKIAEQDTAAESFFMSNVNREAEKRDFLSSFKKVILAPVSVIPSAFNFPSSNTGSSTPKPLPSPTPEPASDYRISVLSTDTSRLSVHSLDNTTSDATNRSSTNLSLRASSPMPLPTTELAAKAAIMNTRLEGIRSLFSLEMALSLVHQGKSSLERAAIFARAGGQTGEEAREQCEAIFITLLQILGTRHIKTGFDTAVIHLSAYNPREAASHSTSAGVAPLVTFLELVSVGDLIQQMVDVFYEQELVAARLTDRHDFLNPAAKEKKRFEAMLDECVAAGLNVGIDALISEVEHLFATTQPATDFNPGAALPPGATAPPPDIGDMGPSGTATQIVALVRAHTDLLTGSTDKNMLDVFNQEVGVRLFAAICKHIKRQRISVDGAIRLIADVNLYASYIDTFKIAPLAPYFAALKELAQIYLIDPSHAKQMAQVIADGGRFQGVFRVEEVYEYAARREDWFRVRKEVERAMYGFGCAVM